MRSVVHKEPSEGPFKPVELTLTLESRAEVEALYAIFNFSAIVKTFSDHSDSGTDCFADIRNQLVDAVRGPLEYYSVFNKILASWKKDNR